jgi:hypothetical protein
MLWQCVIDSIHTYIYIYIHAYIHALAGYD